nr:hypothetical protein [Methylobrevis pamukkalensis]
MTCPEASVTITSPSRICTVSSQVKCQRKVPALQSHKVVTAPPSRLSASLAERASGVPSTIHDGSIGAAVSRVGHGRAHS